MLDFTTILAMVVAFVVFMQLRNVLGKRTGQERPPVDPYARRDRAEDGGDAPVQTGERDGIDDRGLDEGGDDGRVVTLPRREEDDPYADIDRMAPRGTSLNRGLRDIHDSDPDFAPRQFLDGAKAAYEMIVTAFAAGDRDTLRGLLAPEVYDGFEAAITEREGAGEVVEQTFVGIENAALESAAVRDGEAFVAVRVVSQLITATRDRDGTVVDGDPDAVVEVRDVWTFAREVPSDDPNWRLVATEDEDESDDEPGAAGPGDEPA